MKLKKLEFKCRLNLKYVNFSVSCEAELISEFLCFLDNLYKFTKGHRFF